MCLLDFEFTHDGPHEADELASYSDDGDLRGFPGRDAVIELVEPVLGLPRVGDDAGVCGRARSTGALPSTC